MTRKGIAILAVSALTLAGVAAFATGAPHHRMHGWDHRGEHRGEFRAGALFERLDADKDGAVTRAEVDAARAERFAAVDADKDGAVTLAELTAMLTKRAETQASRMMMRADSDDDGVLSPDEMGGRRHARMFERLDADGDGVVTKAEVDEMRARYGHRQGRREGHGRHWR